MKKSILCFLLIVSLCFPFLLAPASASAADTSTTRTYNAPVKRIAISKSNYRLIRLYMARSDNIVRILTLMGKKKIYPLFSLLIMVRKPLAHA